MGPFTKNMSFITLLGINVTNPTRQRGSSGCYFARGSG
jgi:hypothetical protein